MASLKANFASFQDRIRMGSISIPADSLPFHSFLMGYFVGKHGVELDLMFEAVDHLEELVSERLISQNIKKQILFLMEEFPSDIKKISKVLSDYKYGANIDLIRWIESYYEQEREIKIGGRKREDTSMVIEEEERKPPAPVALNSVAVDGTL